MKKFKTYIIYSDNHDIFYKGYTEHLEKRLNDHNQDKSTFTKGKGPWRMVFVSSFDSKTEALKMEKMLKRQNRKYLYWIIDSNRNEIG